MNAAATGLKLALSGAAALAAAVVALAVSAEPPETAEARRSLEVKTAPQREEIRKAYAEFQSLPPHERDALRRLDAEIAADAALRRTLGRYERFFESLPPWEQENLRTTDPAARVGRVAAIVAERSRQDEDRSWRPDGRPGFSLPTLPPAAFDAAMWRLADAVPISDEDRTRLESEPAESRHLEIAKMAKSRIEEARRRAFAMAPWPDDETVDAIVAAIPHEGVRKWHEKLEPDFRRGAVIGLLLRTLVEEWQRVVDESIPREEIRRALDELSAEEREELAQRSSEELIRQAIVRRLAERQDDVGRAASGLRDATVLLQESFSFRRGGPPRDGDGRRGDDRRRGGDGPGDRRPGGPGDEGRGGRPPGPPGEGRGPGDGPPFRRPPDGDR